MTRSLLIVSLLFSLKFYSQIKDSLITFQDIKFKNEAEKVVFKKTSYNEVNDIISALLMSYSGENIHPSNGVIEKIDNCVAKLNKEIKEKSEVKKIKIIYDVVHKTFFSSYKLENSFSDIFSKGEYNCLSGTALYGIILTKLNIPFNVIEAPNHVYLIAYPQTHKILMESTAPQNGYFKFNDNFINQYIKSLYNSKLISKTEFETTPTDKLFEKYYFNESYYNLRDMISLQFSNYAVYYAEEKLYAEALNEIKKAYYFSPSKRNKNTLKFFLACQLQNKDYENELLVNDFALLCRINNLNKQDVSDENIKHEFLRLTESQLINTSNFSMYENSFNKIKQEIKDSSLLNELTFGYHYELSRLGYLNLRDSLFEIPHLLSAYNANPKNSNLQTLILSYFEQLIKGSYDAKKVMKIINQFNNYFTFTKNHPNFNTVKANCILELAYQNFYVNDIKTGENYISEFETLMKNYQETYPNDAYIEKAYSQPAMIYYKKGNSSKARQLLKKGLEYAPGNFGLTVRLDQLK